ncbi:RNA 3'-terminal phosphate cyclase [Hyposmocoma kahamanoa]|uniref:RNA 3'-terminal phosphate cyclase n=1 Tax=Hyposmocoma kahamanoa TaxID=1477025 RepID=UPI000E6D76D9|nr:RNA 3'-terminal phosphate cyclase [Hyposmocoma kahamanoa]
MSELLDIDGSVLEGGGQILRISISLSAVLGVPIRVYNIRAGRKKPGLAAQHLKGIELVAEMCQARLKGAKIGSTEIEFIPGTIKGGHYTADTKTAGSISLLLQVALPVALMASAPVTLDLRGGTNADMAPQIDYMGEVFRYLLNKFGADFSLDVHKRGYYPRGGGHVTIEVTPVQTMRGADLTERGTLLNIHGWSFVAGSLPVKLAYEMAGGVRDRLGRLCKVNIECYKEDREMAPDNCSGIIVVGDLSSGCVVGSDALGSRGAVPRALGAKAGDDLAAVLDNGACVDDHAQVRRV